LDGFPELKIELASIQVANNVTNYEEINKNDPVSTLKDKLMIRIQNVMDSSNKELDDRDLITVVDFLKEADVIQTFGCGLSELVATELLHKFTRLGKTVLKFNDINLISEYMQTAPLKQVLFLISTTGDDNESVTLADIAHRKGIVVISITTDKKSRLSKNSDITLLTSNNIPDDKIKSTETTTLISQLYILDLIYYLYFQRDFDNNIKKI